MSSPSVLPDAVIRRSPEDFVVDELPAYGPSGKGEHLYLTFRKRGLTTPDAVRLLSRALDTDPRAAGFAGMKDRHAVTTQTASFAFPMARDAEAAVAAIALPGLEILGAARHDNKLKPGHLLGNRFTLILRDLPEAAVAGVRARLEELGRTGVPNAFGPQRFGRDGANPARALAWLAGRERGPRDRREQRLLFSALQSLLFNRLLERRVDDGSWALVLPGDLAKKRDSGGLFDVPLDEGPELDDARARALAGVISATGPMYGAKMRWPRGAPLALEQEVLAASELGADAPARLDAFRQHGEGTRRALRMEVDEMAVAEGSTDPAGGVFTTRSLVVGFVLPKGGYATTVLGHAVRLVDAAAPRYPDHGPQTPGPAEEPEPEPEADPS